MLSFLLRNSVFGQIGKTYLFVGTYTGGKPDQGIFVYEFNPKNGNLKRVFKGQNLTNPSYLSLSEGGEFLYACTETKLPSSGSISSFKINPTKGTLTFLNKQNSGGENPVYVTNSRFNKFVINGNYTEGNVSVFATTAEGSLLPASQIIQFQGRGPIDSRQDKAHIHAAVFSPDFEYIFFPDLGSDKIRVFKFNINDTLPLKPREDLDFISCPGSGPRHFTFHPSGKFAYCIEELSGTVEAFRYENGRLDSIQRIFSYSKVQELYNSADIHISPDGLFLYASNRWDNENTISIFSIDTLNGKLTIIGHQSTLGDHPRNFTMDPTGNFLIVANQVSNNIVVFKRDKSTGLLSKVGKEIHVSSPSCLQMRTY